MKKVPIGNPEGPFEKTKGTLRGILREPCANPKAILKGMIGSDCQDIRRYYEEIQGKSLGIRRNPNEILRAS